MNLFDSLEIKNKSFRNRIIVPPMASSTATEKGEITNKTIDHYRSISKDSGMTIVEHSYISESGKYSDNQLGIHKDNLVRGLANLASTIKENESLSCIQINHSGGRKKKELSKKPVNSYGEQKLNETKKNFVEAAVRAKKADFDAIEIHGAHGFLLNSFLSPLTNKRQDKYGGKLKNRIKYPMEIIEEVNGVIDDLLLLFRLGATDLDPNGLVIEESKKIAKELTNRGVDIIDVSGATCGSRPKELQDKEGYFVPQAKEIKKEINKPVIGVGGIKNPEVANGFIKRKQVDFVAIGREMLNNPNWIKEAKKEVC